MGTVRCCSVVQAAASRRDSERSAAELLAEADRLYSARERLDAARRAADLYAAAFERDPQNFEAAWKLARAGYWLGGHVAADAIRAECERGMAGARAALRLAPERPEGHFWLAANMGRLAESQGLRAGLRYRRPIREALEQVLAIDAAFQQGSADRALGRWYFRVPRLFGGSRRKAEAHLRKALTYNPHSTATHFFLAELYLAEDRHADARAALQAVLDAPLDPAWAPEDREFKTRARGVVARLKLKMENGK
jgi:tetratricopeptide (TPR) repeat protein